MGLAQHQREPRMRAQAPGKRGSERDSRRRERGRGDPPGRLGAAGGKIGFRLLDHGQDPLGVPGQPPAGIGELSAPRRPVDQRQAGLPFQRGELLGHGGRRVAEDRGGLGDTAARGEFVQQPEPVEIKHKKSLRSAQEITACTDAYNPADLIKCDESQTQLVPPLPIPSPIGRQSRS
jgi:hypothetical protein